MNLLSILKALGIKISPQIEEAIAKAQQLANNYGNSKEGFIKAVNENGGTESLTKALATLDNPNVARVLTAITSEANDIDIVVPSRTIYNGQCEKLLIQQAIPVSTNGNAVPVKLTIGDASVLLLDRCGNAVFSDQLKSRKIYDIRFHTTALTATILCSIPNCTSGVNTVFNPATPPSEPVPSN